MGLLLLQGSYNGNYPFENILGWALQTLKPDKNYSPSVHCVSVLLSPISLTAFFRLQKCEIPKTLNPKP